MLASNYEFSLIDEHGNSSEFFTHPEYNRYCASQDGDIYNLNSHKFMTQIPNYKGYLTIHASKAERDKRYFSHRFVYECCNNLILNANEQIDHINRDKTNNHLANLRVVNNTTNSLNKHENEEVSSLPDDAIEINEYGAHQLTNLYYSPSNECCYRVSEIHVFKIPFRKIGKRDLLAIQLQDIKSKHTIICLSKLKRLL